MIAGRKQPLCRHRGQFLMQSRQDPVSHGARVRITYKRMKRVEPMKREQVRRWTEAEKQRLFSDYFERLPGTCPVCGSGVHMMMDQDADVVTLEMRCDCGNRATITPPPSGQGL